MLFKANLFNWVHASSALGAKAVLSYRKANFYNKTKSTNIHWVWSFITKCEVNLWLRVLYQKQMKFGNFKRVWPCSFGMIQTSNSKWNQEMWTSVADAAEKCCDLRMYLLQFIFTRFHTFLIITDPSCIGNNFPFELLQYSLFLSSFRAALNTNAPIYHTFFHIRPLEIQLMDH